MARAKLREIAEAAQTDPKKALLDSLGENIEGVEVFHNNVMVATYVAPEKTKGGIIKPDRAIMEDRFQGKIGLVIKIGPLAFKSDKRIDFGGVTINEGDWVFYRPGDGFELFSVDKTNGGTSCRVFEDINIKGRVPDPSVIW